MNCEIENCKYNEKSKCSKFLNVKDCVFINEDFNNNTKKTKIIISQVNEINKLKSYHIHHNEECKKGNYKVSPPFGEFDPKDYPKYGCTCGLDELLKED